jgi:hypothetical protein
MTTSLRNALRMLVLAVIALVSTQANAQLKVGKNPATIKKSAILELEADKQGLLLPRLTSFTGINTAIGTDAVDGMIVYLSDAATPANSGLYMREGTNWVKIASASTALSNWSLKGNTGTDPATDYIGTSDGKDLSIRTNGTEAIKVTTAGNVALKQVATTADNTIRDVLIIETDGTIVKRQLPLSSFTALLAAAGTSSQTFNVSADATTGQLTINAPVMDGVGAKTYGFLQKDDWTKLQNLTNGNGLTVGDLLTAAGSEAVKGAKITFNTTTQQYEMQLVAASATQNGIVTTSAQEFAGAKTFKNILKLETVATAAVPTPGVPYQVLVQNATNEIEKRAVNMEALETAVQKIKAGPTATDVTSGTDIEFLTNTTGTDFSILANGALKTVNFSLPDATGVVGAEARGLVSKAAQSFAGNKSFVNNVAVGTVAAPNSTLQVEGSVAMSIKTISSTDSPYAIDDRDNTILANATAGAITINLPTPSTTIKGRMYTIKKIGSGDIDKEVLVKAGAAQIEGGTDYKIFNDWTFITVQTDGSNWYIVKK